MGKNKDNKRWCIYCYHVEGLVPMRLNIPSHYKIWNDLAYHNVILSQARFHEIFELYDNVSQHGSKNTSLIKFQKWSFLFWANFLKECNNEIYKHIKI